VADVDARVDAHLTKIPPTDEAGLRGHPVEPGIRVTRLGLAPLTAESVPV